MLSEQNLIYFILAAGWPILMFMSYLILQRGCGYCNKLQGTLLGKLMVPTIFGWLFGMFALAVVATAYMLNLDWYITVIPAFAVFIVAVVVLYQTIASWEKQALKIKEFYENLEKLVKERTKELEEAHRKAIGHEKEMQKLKDQFVFIAAHELKTPVTSIRWGLEMALERGAKTFDKETITQLKTVQNSNKRLITLVDDLLNVARIEAGTIKIEPKKTNLVALAKQTIDEMESVFTEKKVKMNFTAPKEFEITTDPDRIKQVLINLLSNASKYNTPKGQVTLEIVNNPTSSTIAVSDTGIGIKKEDLKTLFTKFGRIQNEKTKNIEGTGLGLFLTKEIIEKMGGEIEVASEAGKGTTFTVTLPNKQKNGKPEQLKEKTKSS